MSLDTLPALRDVIAEHGLSARKSLGQNFLLDLNLTAKIARQAGTLEGARVLEIGPGPGGLSRAILAQGAACLTVVERDPRCLPALEEIARAYPRRLHIIEGDALKLAPENLPSAPYKILANLPYNVGTQLLISWLTQDWPPSWESLTLMFQKEVAERIVAKPGTKAYGRLSVLTQWRAKAHLTLTLPPRAFTPPPKVASAVVHITPTAPLDKTVQLVDLERVVQAAFAQRRKMIRASLKSLMPDPLPLITQAGLTPEARADALSVADYVRLAKAYASSG